MSAPQLCALRFTEVQPATHERNCATDDKLSFVAQVSAVYGESGALVFGLLRNTSMNILRSTLAVITAVGFSPLLSHASPGTAPVNNCAHAFAASLAVNGAAPPSYKLQYRADRFSGSFADYYATHDTFELEAHDPKTHAVIARARCSTNTRGAIVALSSLPLGNKDVILSARR
jgi:hypothetical protein